MLLEGLIACRILNSFQGVSKGFYSFAYVQGACRVMFVALRLYGDSRDRLRFKWGFIAFWLFRSLSGS